VRQFHSLDLICRVTFIALVLVAQPGCSQEGIRLELHLPQHPTQKTRLEILIDEQADTAPTRTADGAYVIQVSQDGRATINSPWVLDQWRRMYLVTPQGRYAPFDGYRTIDSGWDMARKTERRPDGSVHSWSVTDGSKYWIEVEINGPPVRAGGPEDR
jgi:hypothetical protein